MTVGGTESRGPEPSADSLLVVSDAYGPWANPYGRLLAAAIEAADEQFSVRSFRPRTLLGSQPPAIWHVHWPETIATHRNPVRALLNVSAVILAVLAARIRSVPIIWTVHNLRAHEGSRRWLEVPFMRWLVRQLDGWISLSSAGVDSAIQHYPALESRPHLVVPHGHYASHYGEPGSRSDARSAADLDADARVLLCLGVIRPYKNVPELVRAFTRADGADLRLVVAGGSARRDLVAEIEDAAAGDPRVILRLGLVSEDDVPLLIAAADGFILSAERILNSGSALLALSFGVPVLVPDTPVMRELQAEIGSGAVQLRDGSVSAAAIEAFADTLDVDRPGIAARTRRVHDWGRIGSATTSFFRTLLSAERAASPPAGEER